MITLDANLSEQVASHQVIEADLGVKGRSLIVASGIAIPGWRIDSDEMHHQDARVQLRIPVDKLERATVHVGLASVSNDDTEHVFAVDTSRVEVDPATGELDLYVRMSLLGEWSALSRFSYQVVATITRVTNEITGSITWPTSVFDPPSRLPSTLADRFVIKANARTITKGFGSFGGDIETLDPLLPGEIISIDTDNEGNVIAYYRISNPPRNRELRVTVDPLGFPAPTNGTFWVAATKPGNEIFTLTVDKSSKGGVNFFGSIVAGPR